MKTVIATACLVVLTQLTLAEPPPSNSYLPPSPSSRSGGYPQGGPGFGGGAGFGGGPQVVAARNLDHNHGAANGLARSNGGHAHGGHAHSGGASARLGGHDNKQGGGYDQDASPFGRSGLDEEPANYNFGYMVNDFQEGTDFGHHEERQDERAEGEYHVVLPDGRKQTVSYEADERGFKPHVSYEDTDALARSNGGYDDDANNVQGNHGNGFGHGSHGNHGNARSNGY